MALLPFLLELLLCLESPCRFIDLALEYIRMLLQLITGPVRGDRSKGCRIQTPYCTASVVIPSLWSTHLVSLWHSSIEASTSCWDLSFSAFRIPSAAAAVDWERASASIISVWCSAEASSSRFWALAAASAADAYANCMDSSGVGRGEEGEDTTCVDVSAGRERKR